jgi:hypothetical protein
MMQLSIDEMQAVDVGLYYRSRWLNNTGHTEIGLLGDGKCLIKNNCSLDSNNKYNYFISNSEEISLIVMSDAKEAAYTNLMLEMDILDVSNDQISLYLIQTFFVLAVSVFGFLFGMKLLIPKSSDDGSLSDDEDDGD